MEIIEIIITFLLEKGGVFGLMLALALAYIFFREKHLFSKDKTDKSAGSEKVSKVQADVDIVKSDISKVIVILDHMKEVGKDHSLKFSNIANTINQLNTLHFHIKEKVDDLHDWHAVFDNEGVPIWYVRKSIVDSIANLENTVNMLNTKFVQTNDALKVDLTSKLQKVNDKRVDELKELLENYNKAMIDLTSTLEKMKSILKTGD